MTTAPEQTVPAPRHRLHLTPQQALACVLPGPLGLDPLSDAARIEEGRRLRTEWLAATEALEAFYDRAAAEGLLLETDTVAVDLADALDAFREQADPDGLPDAAPSLTAVPALVGAQTPVPVASPGPTAPTGPPPVQRGAQPLGSGNIVQVPIGDLVLNGFLTVGDTVHPAEAEWQSPAAVASITRDGLRFPDGTVHKKLSPAASAVTGKASSGWSFWVLSETGERLDSVRERYLGTWPEWVAATRADQAAKRAEKQTEKPGSTR